MSTTFTSAEVETNKGMKASTSIREMIEGKKIVVPAYQRAYSWETPESGSEKKTHIDVFLSDLEENSNSQYSGAYYFGHFLYQHTPSGQYAIIDGQQRLTTITIFLAALFRSLKTSKGTLTSKQQGLYEDMVKKDRLIHFSTVEYDEDFFRDYVIEQHIWDSKTLTYLSAKRIKAAFDYFVKQLSEKTTEKLEQLLHTVSTASCSTYLVESEAEAIQMFIFQNNRGKSPSALEILKADFMFNIHLKGGIYTNDLISEIRRRFETIYRTISLIEYKVGEDEVLNYTLRIYFNNLHESGSNEKIRQLLSDENSLSFVSDFSRLLEKSFSILSIFFGSDEQRHFQVHSLITLGGIGSVLPFIINAYSFGLPEEQICSLCSAFEGILLRHRLIRTRAELTSRLNWHFQQFTNEAADIQPILRLLERLKHDQDWWWRHWNNEELLKSIDGGLHHPVARFILWKYEHHLQKREMNIGYSQLTRYNNIKSPELEHIAPRTHPDEKEASGYCDYDEEFKNTLLNCLGNYLLISKSHNCSIGNIPFSEKYETYTYMKQQLEVRKLSANTKTWTKENIRERKKIISDFVMNTF